MRLGVALTRSSAVNVLAEVLARRLADANQPQLSATDS